MHAPVERSIADRRAMKSIVSIGMLSALLLAELPPALPIVFVPSAAQNEQGRSDAPRDAFWCPMHPNVRSPQAGKCPVCSMDLVPIPPPRIGQYRLEVTRDGTGRTRQARTYRFVVRDPQSNAVVDAFTDVHERLMHLFVIGRDLRFFAHEHPIRAGKGFAAVLDLPPGAYMFIADFLPAGGLPQMIHHAFVTPGYSRSPFTPAIELHDDLADKVVDGLVIHLNVEGVAVGKEAALHFTLSNAVTHAPVRDIEPYLGVSGHLLLVNSDLTQAVHAHPEGAITAGPDLTFGAVFPSVDVFKMWVQVQRAGKVITAPFAVRVPEPE
jgi:Heavy metal binding domain